MADGQEAHERGRQQTVKDLGMDIAYVENVEETNEAVRQVVDLYADRGYNIIVGTSYGFGAGLRKPQRQAEAAFVNVAGDRKPLTRKLSTLGPTKPGIWPAWRQARCQRATRSNCGIPCFRGELGY